MLWLIIGLLIILSAAAMGKGVLHAWLSGMEGDMHLRLREYNIFREGVFPHEKLARGAVSRDFPSTVYPPYALPMFAPFFAWGGAVQGRLMIEILSGVSLGLIGWYGFRFLRWAGPQAAILGAVAGIAISGNGNALAHGQFSILCMGLITAQLLLLEARRPWRAGLCWALAMIKPQIALPFALPFLARLRWPGLALASALLIGLSLSVLNATGVTLPAYLGIWSRPGSLSFVDEGNANLIGLLEGWLQIDATVIQIVLLLVIGILILGWWWRIGAEMADPLQVAAVCAVIGAVGFYHRNYDNIMLYPALLAVLDRAFGSRRHQEPFPRIWILLAGAMGLSLWTPQRLIETLPFAMTGQLIVWLMAGLAVGLIPPSRARGRA